MRPERNPLDLNNFPEDFSSRDGKQALEDTSSSAGGGGGCRKKKSCGKESKDESGKVYECRFCSLKFCKSQALGGHMNRHRQERETETLNRARELVFGNDNLIPPPQLSGQPMVHGGYHHQVQAGYHHQVQAGSMNDPFFPPRFFSGSTSTTVLPPSSQSYMYPSPSRILSYSTQQSPNDYVIGRHQNGTPIPRPEATNFTCIGAPVGQGFLHSYGNVRGGGGAAADTVVSGGGGGGGGRDLSLQNQQRMDLSPMINQYQDGF